MKSNKSNETAIRALETLKLLCFDKYSQDEIIDFIFKSQKSENELRTDSLYKYLNTFKLFGIKIVKNKGKYSLENSLLTELFSSKEIETIKFLYDYSKLICTDKDCNQIKNLLENLLKTSNINLVDLEKIEYNDELKNINIEINKEKLQEFSLLCKDNQRISFDYYNKDLNQNQHFMVEPIEIFITPTGIFLKAFTPDIAEVQNFHTDFISNIKQLPIKSKSMNIKNSVTFALKGRLARTYELKLGERVIKQEKDYLVISNSEEDKYELLRRLLRYGISCQILYPQNFKIKFLKTLNEIKDLYKN